MQTPQQLLEALSLNLLDLEAISKLLIEKRKQYILVEARLLDAKTSAREEYFNSKPCRVSEMRDWLKYRCSREILAEASLKSEIKTIQAQHEIILEVHNTLKTRLRVMGDELRNLNTYGQN